VFSGRLRPIRDTLDEVEGGRSYFGGALGARPFGALLVVEHDETLGAKPGTSRAKARTSRARARQEQMLLSLGARPSGRLLTVERSPCLGTPKKKEPLYWDC
jgi:hypothetical protein